MARARCRGLLLRADNVGSLGAVANAETKKELLNTKECLHGPTTSS